MTYLNLANKSLWVQRRYKTIQSDGCLKTVTTYNGFSGQWSGSYLKKRGASGGLPKLLYFGAQCNIGWIPAFFGNQIMIAIISMRHNTAKNPIIPVQAEMEYFNKVIHKKKLFNFVFS